MNRASWVLLFVIALELVGAAVWFQGRTPVSEDLPRPDLGILDSASAAEVLSRQDRVQKNGKAESWTDLSMIYVIYGHFREADICCRRSAALNPKLLMNNFWWGTTLYRLGRTKESSEKFRAAIPSDKPSTGHISWYCIGLNLLREEQPDEAENAFKNASGLAPADYELAKLQIRSGRAKQAVPVLEKLTDENPQSVRYWLLRASAAEALGDTNQAEVYREQADRVSELDWPDELMGFLGNQIEKYGLNLQIQNGKRQMESGHMTDAAEVLRDALSREWRPLAADLLAEAELAIGRPDESIHVLTEAMSRFSATPARVIALGDAWRAKRNPEESVRQWERATRLHLAGPAHARLADHYSKVGDQPLATRHRALAVHAEGLDAFRHDRLPDAGKSFAMAVELAPDQAHSWFYLGECRRFLNDPSAAEAYQRCLDINKYHGRARRSLRRLTTLQQP